MILMLMNVNDATKLPTKLISTRAPSENRPWDPWDDKQAFYPSATEHGQRLSLESELKSCISEFTSSGKPQL